MVRRRFSAIASLALACALSATMPGVAIATSGPGGDPASGMYQCFSFGGAGGAMKIEILGAGRYANEQGTAGDYDLDGNGNMVFVSGPWEGYFGRALDDGKLGLTHDLSGNFFGMSCNRA